MAKPEWGAKRTCEKCGSRFYDLNRDPATCPTCGTLRGAKPLTKPQRIAAAAGAEIAELPPESRPRSDDDGDVQAEDKSDTEDRDDLTTAEAPKDPKAEGDDDDMAEVMEHVDELGQVQGVSESRALPDFPCLGRSIPDTFPSAAGP